MNKSELIEVMAEKEKLPESEAAAVINTILKTISDALARGEHVQIRGFGSFSIKKYGSYNGRNPKTGEKVIVSPKKLPVFKVGKHFRKAVNENRPT